MSVLHHTRQIFSACEVFEHQDGSIQVEATEVESCRITYDKNEVLLSFTCPAFRDDAYDQLDGRGERLAISGRPAIRILKKDYYLGDTISS